MSDPSATPPRIASLGLDDGRDRADAAGTHQLRYGRNQMDEKDGEVTHYPRHRSDQLEYDKTWKSPASMRQISNSPHTVSEDLIAVLYEMFCSD